MNAALHKQTPAAILDDTHTPARAASWNEAHPVNSLP